MEVTALCRGFPRSLLHQELTQQEGDAPCWLVQCPRAGKWGGTGFIFPQPLLPPGWEAEPFLLSLQLQQWEGGGRTLCWHGQHCQGCQEATAQNLFDVVFFSHHWRREQLLQLQKYGACACLLLPSRAGSGKVGAALIPCTALGGGVNANAGILQCCTLVLFVPASLPNLVGNTPAFPVRSALLRLCSLRSACTC